MHLEIFFSHSSQDILMILDLFERFLTHDYRLCDCYRFNSPRRSVSVKAWIIAKKRIFFFFLSLSRVCFFYLQHYMHTFGPSESQKYEIYSPISQIREKYKTAFLSVWLKNWFFMQILLISIQWSAILKWFALSGYN